MYELMNKLDETWKGPNNLKERRGWIFDGTQTKIAKKNQLELHKKIHLSLYKYRYLECTKNR